MTIKKVIRYTLLADGSSDAALVPIIDWTIEQNFSHIAYASQYARDLGKVGLQLEERVTQTLLQFPCDILFLHRDAENEGLQARLEEIAYAVATIGQSYVPIIPVRMTEAWMLSDETAIRAAAGNSHSKVALDLPKRDRWEKLPDPKAVLFNALTVATEKKGRALNKFYPDRHRHRVTQLTENFGLLRGLDGFDGFEKALIAEFNKIIKG
ncbi:MAG: hypothetical protein H7315_02865 [Herminiimonas sp.]|nr:hypothetical protein [Herminiimonas sp.]